MGKVLDAFSSSACPEILFHLAGWLATRTYEVYANLCQHALHSTINRPPFDNTPDWCVTGSWYGGPPLRLQPSYPGIPNDGLHESQLNKEDSQCGKYYNQYTKAKLTGGLMILWCRHSIGIGFHIMPTAEGRNDVFSALYCHWPKAPKIVVYDFACQLAPYCIIREPEFFGHTRFVVDELHASDHTKCSHASHANFVMQYDPQVQAVNTSAAEVGNSGAAKIRKSVSYMKQSHAIKYVKVYMDIMNRCKTRLLESKN